MSIINRDAVSDLLLKFTLGQYPYALDSEWVPIEEAFNRLHQHGSISKFYLKQNGLLDDQGQWHPDLIEYGLFKVVSYRESDSATGYSQRIRQTLVSDRGRAFLIEFFDQMI